MNPPASRELLLIVGLGGVFFGALFLFVGWRLWREGRELRSAGISTQAKILKKFRKSEDRSWGGLENYYVLCGFEDETGLAREVEIKVPSKGWRWLREGSTLPVTFVPGQIETARAGARWGWKLRGAIGIIVMLYGLAALVVFPLGAIIGWFQ